MNFYPFNIGDYSAATRHLSWDEDLAFRRLIDAYYNREEPLPVDRRQVYRLALAQTAEHRQAVDVVLEEFFTETVDGWVNHRCEEEIIRSNDRKNKASASAQIKWSNAKTKESPLPLQSEGNANASDSECERIENSCEGNAPNTNTNTNVNPNPLTPIADKSAVVVGFEKFWAAYPRKVAKPNALKAWRAAKVNPEFVMDGLAKFTASDDWLRDGGKYVPHPATWLNQRRWEDETAVKTKLSSIGGLPANLFLVDEVAA